MCGIAGFLGQHEAGEGSLIARRMAAALEHRGPDDTGIWLEPGIALAHRRLSIIDLTAAGHQPMLSGSGRYVLTFNGELYNHLELRQSLGSYTWRGHSDTETLLASVETWGIIRAIEKFAGMFAFALWDRQERSLTLARDRLGEKPLYYGWTGGAFLFGSELKALRIHPRWHGELNRDALANYMRYGYVPSPDSIFSGIKKLQPGTFLTLRIDAEPDTFPEPKTYWSPLDLAGRPTMTEISIDEATEQLEYKLRQVIRRQLISDVPIGAFLSGGIDSSTVVALMQAISDRPAKTFSIGFSESSYDEAKYAKAVAKHLGTNHQELYVSAEDALNVIPLMPSIFDEPFGDSSGIPTYLVAKLARQHVSVSLSGDGGDELFGGYNRYRWGTNLWRVISLVPRDLRRLAANILMSTHPDTWNALGEHLPLRFRQSLIGDKLHKLACVIKVNGANQLYRHLISQQHEDQSIVIGGIQEASCNFRAGKNLIERMMLEDLIGYLPNDILTKIDRSAMATSLETRVPFLDHKLVEFVLSLPQNMKIRHGQGKWLLRQVLYQHVPQHLIERPKQGFAVPLGSWLRGPLKHWAESLINEERLRREGFLKPEPIRKKWEEHLSGQRNWQYWLWNVLMFQAWHGHWQVKKY
jgi:asparagine synthase (glutamine-hydrolysing)